MTSHRPCERDSSAVRKPALAGNQWAGADKMLSELEKEEGGGEVAASGGWRKRGGGDALHLGDRSHIT